MSTDVAPLLTVFNGTLADTTKGPYALLLGDYLAVWLDSSACLGAPRYATGTSKPGGPVNAAGLDKYLNADGSVQPTPTPNAYCMSYSVQPNQTIDATVLQALLSRYEYVSAGTLATQEGWSLQVGTGAFWAYSNTAFGPLLTNRFTATQINAPDAGGILVNNTTNSNTTFFQPGSGTALQITHEWNFNGSVIGRKNVLTCSVVVKNVGSTSSFPVRYCRYINPNQDVPYNGSGSVDTNQSLTCPGQGTTSNVGINSEGPVSLRNLTLACDPVLNPGVTFYAISGTTTETNALTQPLTQLASNNYVQIHANGDGGADYVNRTNAALDGTTTSIADYFNDPNSAPFLTSGSVPTTPTFSTPSSDIDLCLLHEAQTLGANGSSVMFQFAYVFDLPIIPPAPPAYVPCPDYGAADQLQGWAGVRHVTGQRQGGGISPGRVPCGCRPTMCLNAITVINSANYPRVPLYGRNDVFTVSALDLLTEGVATTCIRYYPPPVTLQTGPTRSTRKHASRVRIFGRGTITDGTLKVNIDPPHGPTCTYSAVGATRTSEYGVLMMQELDKSMVGRVAEVDICVDGVGVEFEDVMFEVADL